MIYLYSIELLLLLMTNNNIFIFFIGIAFNGDKHNKEIIQVMKSNITDLFVSYDAKITFALTTLLFLHLDISTNCIFQFCKLLQS